MADKNVFNDPLPFVRQWKYCCPDCRCEFDMKVTNYPHGPWQVTMCPVCGSESINTQSMVVVDAK